MRSLKPKIQLTCLNCGEMHLKLPCQLTRGRGKYCSKKCRTDSSRKQVEIACDGCKTLFMKFPCELSENENFCTVECYGVYRRNLAKPTTYLKIGRVHEHIVVAERVLGRKLLADEVVHHLDEVKHNNNPENLAVLPNQTIHARYHMKPESVDLTPYLLKNYL